jgi:hypothetical protein
MGHISIRRTTNSGIKIQIPLEASRIRRWEVETDKSRAEEVHDILKEFVPEHIYRIDTAEHSSEFYVRQSATEILWMTVSRSYIILNCADWEHMFNALKHRLSDLKAKPKSEDSVLTHLWWVSESAGSTYETKEVNCPVWDTIRANYPSEVSRKLDSLLNLPEFPQGGSIILWYGPPGTGKTYMIRALCRAWQKRFNAKIDILIDKNILSRDAYVIDLISNDNRDDALLREVLGPTEVSYSFTPDLSKGNPPRIVLIEDAPELFCTDLCRNSPGFAKLLNLSDGILGQGQQLIFILTSNEPIDAVDPALLRKGRCIQSLEFRKFTEEEAVPWLLSHGKEASLAKGDMTLAELFHNTEEDEVAEAFGL